MIKVIAKGLGFLAMVGLIAVSGYGFGIRMYHDALSNKQGACQVNVIKALSEKNMLTDLDYYANMYLCMTSN